MSNVPKKSALSSRFIKNPVFGKFIYDEEEDKSECKTCNLKMTGHHAENLLRHLKRKHTEEFKEVESLKCAKVAQEKPALRQLDIDKYMTNACVKVEITRPQILEACLDLVTKNGRPLALMEDSGFQKLMAPLCKAFHPPLCVNRQNVRDLIIQRANIIKTNLKQIVKNRIISLKVDCASRLERSIIGINIQLIINGKIQIHTLAMKEIHQEHTGIHLAEEIEAALKTYDISLNQIYTLTVDNGRNIVRAGTLLNNNAIFENNEQSGGAALTYMDDEEEEVVDVDPEEDIEEEDQNENSLFDINQDGEMQVDLCYDSITTIRCACHTLQLAVKDFTVEICSFLPAIRGVCKKLRTPTIMNLLKLENLPKAILDCVTRWNSTYKMCKRLLFLKEFCIKSSRDIKELRLSHLQWQQLTNFVNVLEPVYEICLKLQGVDLTASDFYFAWYTCRKKIEKKTGKYAPILLNALKKRGESILFSPPILSCVYLDPRFQILLSVDEREIAKAHLQNLYERKTNLNNSILDSSLVSSSSSASPSFSEDEVENILKQLDSNIPTYEGKDALSFIKDFDGIKRLPYNTNIFEFWENYPDKEMKELAQIVIAVPSTQVSVERAFSTLKFILSDLRSSIEENLLEDILLINLN